MRPSESLVGRILVSDTFQPSSAAHHKRPSENPKPRALLRNTPYLLLNQKAA
ncbi:hypothetical protein HMPREF9120_00682 [Neisseria sp. oral taxon 020 str. F0370]|nr:hypothetical protein HMPREF9120_00682 [Neisseria sp. oral taxon 020 str. F0370]